MSKESDDDALSFFCFFTDFYGYRRSGSRLIQSSSSTNGSTVGKPIINDPDSYLMPAFALFSRARTGVDKLPIYK